MKAFISTTTFAEHSDEPLKLLKDAGISYTLNPFNRKITEAEIKDILKENDYWGLIAGTESLTQRVLQEAKALRVISRVGAGIDNIDLDAAKELNIKVYNTPDGPTDAVAELTIALIMNCLRKTNLCDRNIRRGAWKKEMGCLLKGKTIGIIGMGRIGRRVAEIARAFETDIIFCDIQEIKTLIARQVPLKELLESSDIVSIHASGKSSIISKKEIELMKEGAILINTARGGMVDEEALYNALVSGRIAYAAVDTFEKEPYNGKLLELDNILLTPHIGSYAREARVRMESEAVKNLIKGLNEKDTHRNRFR